LFCLHPGTGLCWPYTNLLAVTTYDQPIYGIQARGFAADSRRPESLDEIVAESLERIRAVQPRGPYRVAGWSFGGIIAHNMATRLQGEGEEVQHLILFDAYPPESVAEHERARSRYLDDTWREIALATGLTVPRTHAGTLEAATIRGLARSQHNVLGHFTLEQLEALAAVMNNNTRLA